MASIQNVRQISNPQKAYEWEVEVQGLSTGSVEDIKFFAKSVTIPPSSVEQIIVNYKATQASYAGRDSSGHTVTLTFWDDEANTVRNFFQNWHDNLVMNPITGGSTSREIYSADVVIRMMNSGSTEETSRVRLGHAFPTEIGEISLSYDSSEHVEVSVTLSYDEKVYEG